MSNRLGGSLGTAYRGTAAIQPPDWTFADRDPNQYDTLNYEVGDLWLNTASDPIKPWVLVSLAGDVNSKGQLAEWIQWGNGGSGSVQSLTGNTGGAVFPDTNANINVLGDTTTINIAGDPGTNTLTVTTDGSVSTQFTTNDLSVAIPVDHNIDVIGVAPVYTQALPDGGDKLFIGVDGTVATEYVADVGTAVPAFGVLNVVGGTNVDTSASGNTITINTSTDIATSYVTDSGTAVPAAGVLNIVGANSIQTSGSGNTVTVGLPTTYTSWTPTLNFGGGSTGITYSDRTGIAYRIGNVGFFSGRIGLSNKGSSTGAAQITGIPFNRDLTVASISATMSWTRFDMTIDYPSATVLRGQILESGSTCVINLQGLGPNGGDALSITDNAFVNTTALVFNGFVFIAP